MSRLLAVLVALGGFPSPLVGVVPLAASQDPPVAVLRDIMVPMRDGIRLATDVYLPAATDGQVVSRRLPTILQRVPSDKERPADMAIARYFASHGYAFVIQNTRGRFKSEGAWRMLDDDGRDGVDTCAWISRRPWSDGQVGMFGFSYHAGTQHVAALARPPELKTVVLVDAMASPGHRGIRYGGAFELRFFNWIFDQAAEGSMASRDPATAGMLRALRDQRAAYLDHLPLVPGRTPLRHAPEYESWIVEALSRGADDAFWAAADVLDRAHEYKDIPVYLIGGWYDSWAGGTTATYRMLRDAIDGPVSLMMGPWTHGRQQNSAHGQVSFGPAAAIPDLLELRRAWYDRWLKGLDNAVGKRAPFATPVRVFVMGTGDGGRTEEGLLNHGGYWREEQDWPLDRARTTSYYLGSGGGLSTTPPSREDAGTRFTFDPRDPVPTIGGSISSGAGILVEGAWNQRGGPHIWNWRAPIPLSARRDVLVFQTEPLEEDLEVTGELEARLWVSSSAVDTDFTAKLIDVYPSSDDFPAGFDLNLSDGIVRTRFRESLTRETPMTPGQVYQLTVALYPTANVFKRGHRLRVDVSSSNFPRFDVNPNSGEPLNRHRRLVVATNTVYHDAARPSHIALPVVPGGANRHVPHRQDREGALPRNPPARRRR